MVTITTTGSSVIFEFENCPTYLQNGTIEVPKNALSLTLDGSNMATFRKAASNDIFVSVSLDELDMDEEELMEVFAEMCSTGGSEEEIQELSGKVSTLSGSVTAHTSDSTIHVTSQDKTNWDAKASTSDIEAAVSVKADTSSLTAVSNDVETLSGTVTGLSSDVSTLSGTVTGISSDVSTLSGTVTGLTSDVSTISGTVTFHTSNGDIHVTSTDKTNWNGAVTASTANTTALGGVKLVKITQSAYDQLQTKDPNTLYIITES